MQPIGLFLGAATLDLHYLVPSFPDPNTKGPAERFGIYAGGPAANAAVAFAHLGGTAHLYTEVGVHPLGRAVAADLGEHGVHLHDMTPDSAYPPMLSSILTSADTGDRTVVASRYPDTASSGALPGALPSGARVLLVDGFLHPACRDGAEQASRAGIPVVLDAGSWKPGLDGLLPFVDAAICSAEFRPPGATTHADVLGYLAARGIRRAAISRGPDPILVADGGSSGAVPVEPVSVVDTLGAGDVLHGAFCYHLAVGSSFSDALSEAAAVATHSTRSFGTRTWMLDSS